MVSALASGFKSLNRIELASLAFYIVSGIILLVYLPLTGYAPQLGLLGILSLVVAYSIVTKCGWAPYAIFILLVGASTFSIYTLVSAGFSNALLAVSMIVYAVLTWVFAVYLLLIRRKPYD